jgi:hypothetical protein
MKGHFAYVSNYLTCGGCGACMCLYNPPTPIDNEYTYRVYCGNPTCPNYLEVYEPSDKIKVSLIPTKLRAPDPMHMLAAQQQTQVRMATGVAGMPTTFEMVGTMAVDNRRGWTEVNIPNRLAPDGGERIPLAEPVAEPGGLIRR